VFIPEAKKDHDKSNISFDSSRADKANCSAAYSSDLPAVITVTITHFNIARQLNINYLTEISKENLTN